MNEVFTYSVSYNISTIFISRRRNLYKKDTIKVVRISCRKLNCDKWFEYLVDIGEESVQNMTNKNPLLAPMHLTIEPFLSNNYQVRVSLGFAQMPLLC